MVFSTFPALFLKTPIFSFENHAMAIRALGAAFAAAPLAEFLFTPFLGKLSDLWGRKHLLQASLLLNVFAHFLLWLAIQEQHYLLLLVARFLMGMACGNMAMVEAKVADSTRPRYLAFRFNLLQIAMGAGMFLGPMIAGYFLNFGHFTAVILALACLNGGLFFWVSIYFQDSPVCQKPASIVAKLPLSPALCLLYLTWFIFMLGWTYYFQFFGVFLQQVLSMSPLRIGQMFAYLGLLYLLYQILLVQGSTLFLKPEKVVLPAVAMTALFIFLMGFSHQVLSLYILLPAYGISMALFMPNFHVLIARASESRGQRGFGGLLSLRALTTVLGSLLGSSFLIFSPRSALFGAGLLIFISVLPLAWYLKTRHNPRNIMEN